MLALRALRGIDKVYKNYYNLRQKAFMLSCKFKNQKNVQRFKREGGKCKQERKV